MENTAPDIWPSGVQPTSDIADLRNVPLDQLAAQADCDHILRRIMRRQGSASRVDVAAFSSAI